MAAPAHPCARDIRASLHIKVNIQVQCTAKTLNQGDGTGVGHEYQNIRLNVIHQKKYQLLNFVFFGHETNAKAKWPHRQCIILRRLDVPWHMYYCSVPDDFDNN